MSKSLESLPNSAEPNAQREPAGINPQRVINSSVALSLAYLLARTVPPRFSDRLIGSITGCISRRKSWEMVQAVRLNQWVVSGGSLTPAGLDQAVAATFAHSGRCLYNLYHRQVSLDHQVEASPEVKQYINLNLEHQLGMVVVAAHFSNFDLVGRWLGGQGVTALAIGLPQPASGYQLQNNMRRRVGFEVLPASRQAMREAAAYLQSGGTVMTGIDRPIPGSRYRPCFFGRPASLPVLHISLALQARVPVIVAGVEQQANNLYRIWATDPIHMRSGPNHHAEIISNAEITLSIIEEHIRKAPHQWLMFYPVWPEAFSELPA